MHELNLEQGAETQISCVVELLQISADNKAIIWAEMEASSNPLRWQHWQKLQPNVFLHGFSFLNLVPKSKTFSYGRSLVKTQECCAKEISRECQGLTTEDFLTEERDKDLEQVSERHHYPFLFFFLFSLEFLSRHFGGKNSEITWVHKYMVWKYFF